MSALVPIQPRPVAVIPSHATQGTLRPLFLVPTSKGNRITLPIRVTTTSSCEPQTIIIKAAQPQPTAGREPETGISDVLPSTQQRREFLKRKIKERPSRQFLVTKHILHPDSRVEPFVSEKTHQLRKQSLVTSLNRKIRERPGPLDLITKKILQVDAELEEAIQEGRLLFPSKSCSFPFSVPSPAIPSVPSPSVLLSTHLERTRISKEREKKEQEEQVKKEESYEYVEEEYDIVEYGNDMDGAITIIDGGSRSKIRKQKHPYRLDHQPISNTKSKMRAPEYKRIPMEYTLDEAVQSSISSPIALLVHQQKFINEWSVEKEHRKTVNDEESDSEGTIPYSDTAVSPNYMVAMNGDHQAESHIPCAPPAPALVQRNCSVAYRPPIQRLGDLKVAELKEECKIRSMPLSGTKGQLVDRLKNYEEEIVSKHAAKADECTACKGPSIHCGPVPSPHSNERTLSNTSSSSSPVTLVDDRHSLSSDAHLVEVPSGMQRVDESLLSRRHSLPNSYHYAHTNHSISNPSVSCASQRPSPAPQQPMNTLPTQPNTAGQPRIIQLVDQNGRVFLATVRDNGGLINNDGQSSTVFRLSANPGGSAILERVPAAKNEPIFRFAQNGCGGQLTFARTSPSSDSPPQMPVHLSSQPITVNQSSPQPHPSTLDTIRMATQHPPPSFAAQTPLHPTVSIVQEPKKQHPNPAQINVQQSQYPSATTSFSRDSQPRPSRDDEIHVIEHQRPDPSHPVENQPHVAAKKALPPRPVGKKSPPKAVEEPCDSSNMQSNEKNEEKNDGVIDLTDILSSNPQYRFDEKTISQHEDMMRLQQKKIALLQKEIKRSQAALKQQQQLIVAAKKAQQNELSKKTNGRVESPVDAWLLQLDIKQLNKFHMQFFLNHRQQGQSAEGCSTGQQELETEENRLQMEEHVEQAVQDIVRLIRQDSRTALLIVQLLRKYQLERNSQAPETKDDSSHVTPTTETIPNPGGVTLLSRPQNALKTETVVQQKQATKAQARAKTRAVQNAPGKSSKVPPLVIISDEADSPHSQQHATNEALAATESVRADLQARASKGVDMEEIFKSVLDPSKTTFTIQPYVPPSVEVPTSSHKISMVPVSSTSQDPLPVNNHNFHKEQQCYVMNEDVHMEEMSSANGQFQLVHHGDILMEAIESSGISDPHMSNHEEMDPLMDHNDHTNTLDDVVPSFMDMGHVDMDDLMDILRCDQDQPISRSNSTSGRGVQYNGSAELNQILGDGWMEEAREAQSSRNLDVFGLVDDSTVNGVTGEEKNNGGGMESPLLSPGDVDWIQASIRRGDSGLGDMHSTFNYDMLFQTDAPCSSTQ